MTGSRMIGDVTRLRKEIHSSSSLWQKLKDDLGMAHDIRVVGPDVTRPRKLMNAGRETGDKVILIKMTGTILK